MSVQLAVVVADADGDDGHGVVLHGKMSQSQLSKSSSRPWSREVNTCNLVGHRLMCVAVKATTRFSLCCGILFSVLVDYDEHLHVSCHPCLLVF